MPRAGCQQRRRRARARSRGRGCQTASHESEKCRGAHHSSRKRLAARRGVWPAMLARIPEVGGRPAATHPGGGHSAAPRLLSAEHPWADTNIDANPAQATAVAPGMDHSPDYDEQYVLKDSRAQISRDSVVAASTGYSASAILPSLRIALLLMQIQNLRKDRFRVERQRRETARLDTILRCVVPDERV